MMFSVLKLIRNKFKRYLRIRFKKHKLFIKRAFLYIKRNGVIVGAFGLLYKLSCRILVGNVFRLIKKSNANYIMFDSKPDFSDNSLVLYEYMLQNGYNEKYKIIWLVYNTSRFKKLNIKNVKFVKKQVRRLGTYTISAHWYTLKSKYIFFTHSFMWIENKRDDQLFINLWHGSGYKASRRLPGMGNKFNFVLVPGDLFIETKAEFFDCDKSQVLALGYSRYDLLKNSNEFIENFISSLHEKFDMSGIKKTIIWMPTFFKPEDLFAYQNPIPHIIGMPLINSNSDLNDLDNFCCSNGICLILKSHRHGSSGVIKFERYKNIKAIDDSYFKKCSVKMYEVLSRFDALVTDYSSVAVDYLLVNKPIAYVLNDMEAYEKTRGFVFEDPKEYMPGDHLYNLDDLKDFLKKVINEEDEYADRRAKVSVKMHNITDDYSKRIFDYFLKGDTHNE